MINWAFLSFSYLSSLSHREYVDLVTLTLSWFCGQQPAINVLKEIRTFLDGNPSEVITIFLEDYTASGSLPKVFNASGLMKYWFPVAKMPKSGGDWPLLKDMISQNERLLVFTSKKSKEASEGIAYEWSYVVENQCRISKQNWWCQNVKHLCSYLTCYLLSVQMEMKGW